MQMEDRRKGEEIRGGSELKGRDQRSGDQPDATSNRSLYAVGCKADPCSLFPVL
jgi:hypothetical protein